MTASTVFVTGTPPASWLDAAGLLGSSAGEASGSAAFVRWHDQVVGAAGAARVAAVASGKALVVGADAQAELAALVQAPGAGGPRMLTDARACWTLDALRHAVPDACCLFLIEDPVRALVHWLQAGDGEDPSAALAIWHAGAQRLWRHAQQHGDRCLLVQADELRADPAALRRAVQDRWGLALPGAGLPPPATEVDPLAWALCESIVAGDADSRELHEELLAASLPLVRSGADADSLSWARRLDPVAAVRRQRELVGELDDARQQLQRTRAELSRARGAAQDAQAEGERLLLRLHQVQGELEHYFVAHQALVDDAGRGPAAIASLDIEQLVFGAERTQPPHRQVDVALVKVAYGARQIDRIDLRLLNHHGRPGLLFFGGGGVAPPLSAWQASGQEGERPYWLLIPSEPAGRQALAHLGTTDWGLLVDVVHRLERALRDTLPELRDRWLATALRLQAELRELSARFRYDAVTVTADDTVPPGALHLAFSQVLAGDHAQSRVDLHWWPSPAPGQAGGGAAISLLADPDPTRRPLLGLWPIDDDGRWAAALPLPVGTGLARDHKRRAWAGFAPADRETILSLLDALPAAVRAMPDTAMAPGLSRAALDAAAQSLIRDARRSARQSALWRAARAVKRRLLGR
jgi:hypothetical protein